MTTDTKATAEAVALEIGEQMGFGIQLRSCECGSRPCKRLLPLMSALDTARVGGIEAAADEIPTSWLDPLLTGPDAVLKTKGGTWGCPEVKALLRGVKDRIRALLPEKVREK